MYTTFFFLRTYIEGSSQTTSQPILIPRRKLKPELFLFSLYKI